MGTKHPQQPLNLPKILAFSLIMTVLFFGVLEGTTRLFFTTRCSSVDRMNAYLERAGLLTPPGQQPSLQRSLPMPFDPYLIWHLIPGFRGQNLGAEVYHNARGLRSPEVPLEKPAHTVRILLLGDSTTYGHGVDTEQILRTRLETRLQATARGQTIQVINGGVPGYSSLQSLNLLRRVAIQYEPDIVVVMNLWSDCIYDQFEDKTLIYGEGFRGHINRLGQDVDEVLAPNSAFYCLLKEKVFQVAQQSCAGQPPLCIIPPDQQAGAPARADQAYRQVRQPGASTPDTHRPRVSLSDYRANLKAIARLAEGIGAQVVYAVPINRRDAGEEDSSQPTPQQYAPYRKVMCAVAASRHTPCIDLPSAFSRAARNGSPPLFMDLVHPTAVGNAVMSDTIAAALLENPTSRQILTPERTSAGQ